MTEMLLKDLSTDSTATDDRLRKYETQLLDLKKSTIQQEKQISSKQTQKLKLQIQRIKQIKLKTQTHRVEAQNNLNKIKAQAQLLKSQLKGHEKDIIGTKNVQQQNKQQIAKIRQVHYNNCVKRVQLAAKIDLKKIKKLDIDERKSHAHQVWKWCIVAFYGQPQSKYYWPNFLQQAFQIDQGADLRERLGKIDALNSKQQARVKTIKFIQHKKIVLQSKEYEKFKPQIETIYEIAQLFASSNQIGKKIKQYEKQIEAYRKNFQMYDQKTNQTNKNFTALNERINVTQQYVNQLKFIQKTLNQKDQIYKKQLSVAQKFLQDLSKLSSLPELNVSSQRQFCQCSIV